MQPPSDSPALEVHHSTGFAQWLAGQRLSLAFTTYQAGKLFLVGTKPDGTLSVFERSFNRCMGICCDGQTMWLASQHQIWRLENCLESGQHQDGFDRVFVPQVGYTTGETDVHDVAVDHEGRLLFVNTLFSCLATVSERYSFEPVWKPPFISRLVTEDRCHLNGLAIQSGGSAFVTMVATTDTLQGWREHRRGGGCVMETRTDQTVCRELSMPHSPRFHDGRLWLLNSGTGHLGYVDLREARFREVTFCPGYLRGLSFHDRFAVVGVSKPRGDRNFAGLELDDRLHASGKQAECGLQVIDLTTGGVAHWMRIEGVITELYDVALIPGVMRPKAIGFKTDEIRRTVSVPGLGE